LGKTIRKEKTKKRDKGTIRVFSRSEMKRVLRDIVDGEIDELYFESNKNNLKGSDSKWVRS